MANEVESVTSAGTPPTGQTGARTIPAQADAAETFSHLFKMSATAGVATTDYAAINALAIVAVILAVASVSALAWDKLLIVPAAGAICAILAFRQIGNSNGTQTGKGLALGALLLSLGLGGTVLAMQSVRYGHRRAVEREISTFINEIGDDIRSEKYDVAYQKFTSRFRDRVDKPLFNRTVDSLNQSAQGGRLESIRWNNETMVVQQNPDTGADNVTAMTFLKFAKIPQPEREVMTFAKEGGRWAVDDIPQLFPAERRRGGRSAPTEGP